MRSRCESVAPSPVGSLASHVANTRLRLDAGIVGRLVVRLMASLHIATTLRTVLLSYLIVVVVRNTVTLAAALVPTLTRVRYHLRPSEPATAWSWTDLLFL